VVDADGELAEAGQPVFSDPSGVRAAVTRVVLGLAIVAMIVFLIGFGVELTRSPWPRGVGLPGLTPRPGTVTIKPDHRLAVPAQPGTANDGSVAPGGTSGSAGDGPSATSLTNAPSAGVPPPGATTLPPSATTVPVAAPTTAPSPRSTAPGITTATTRQPQTTSTIAHGPPVSTPGGTTPTTARGRAP
jgi:hypothetical protein